MTKIYVAADCSAAAFALSNNLRVFAGGRHLLGFCFACCGKQVQRFSKPGAGFRVQEVIVDQGSVSPAEVSERFLCDARVLKLQDALCDVLLDRLRADTQRPSCFRPESLCS